MTKTIDKFDGTPYAFMSNFYLAPVEYEGIVYPTSEAAFQAAKTFNTEQRQEIAQASHPSEAKKLGNLVDLRTDWEDVKYDVMKVVVRNKFSQNPELAQKLLDTEDAFLKEGNTWHDNCWGDCTCERCADKPGTNWLGQVLMEVREELKNQREE